MQVRPVTPDDEAAVRPLFAEMAVYYGDGSAPGPDDLDAAARHLCRPPDGGPIGLAALDGARALGMAVLNRLFPCTVTEGLLLKDLFVAEAARGRGVGTELFRASAGYALRHGFERLDWTADLNNPGALGFYERLGTPQQTKLYYRLSGADLARFAGGDA